MLVFSPILKICIFKKVLCVGLHINFISANKKDIAKYLFQKYGAFGVTKKYWSF